MRFDMLFDADAYYRSGCCPWTFFAYPTSLADDRGLPPDDEACGLLAQLQQYGVEVAVWVNGIVNNTTYFACRLEDRYRLDGGQCTRFEQIDLVTFNLFPAPV